MRLTKGATRDSKWVRRLRFRLAAVFALVTFVCVAFGTMAWQVRRHGRVLSDLQRKGAECYGERAVASSLSRFFGMSNFFTEKGFKYVILWGPQFNSADVRSLRGLMGVESIGLIEVPVQVGDIAALKGLGGLRVLNLGGAPIRDELVDEITGLPTVRFLVLADTRLTTEGYRQLEREYSRRAGCARCSLDELRDAYNALLQH
jgi:hypothetical protein